MAEEASTGDFEMAVAYGRDDGRVTEWESGLPSADDLTPLSQSLISPELASAFSISPEPARTVLDVHRASQTTMSHLLLRTFSCVPRPFAPFPDDPSALDAAADVPDGTTGDPESPSFFRSENSSEEHSNRSLKRQRLVWTPQLHKRFVDVVNHLGVKNAVPKTIMQLMNVGGLTRENVASHLQKYRLYLKRMQGPPDEGPSSSADHLFVSTSVPLPTPYGGPAVMPVPVFGMVHTNGRQDAAASYHGYDCHQQYRLFGGHRRD